MSKPGHATRSPNEFLEAAKTYVDSQMATMEKYGSRPDLSEGEYRGLIMEVAQITAKWATTRAPK